MERKDDIFAISHETNNGSIVNIAHQVSFCSLTWGDSPLGTKTLSYVTIISSSNRKNQSMGVESEGMDNMSHAIQEVDSKVWT